MVPNSIERLDLKGHTSNQITSKDRVVFQNTRCPFSEFQRHCHWFDNVFGIKTKYHQLKNSSGLRYSLFRFNVQSCISSVKSSKLGSPFRTSSTKFAEFCKFIFQPGPGFVLTSPASINK